MTPLVAKKAFLAGVICRTQGWYVQHEPPEIPGPGLQWRFWIGADVHDRARQWLGPGTMLRRTPLEAAIADTKDAVNTGTNALLFETTFTWNGLVARADAIRRVGGEWELIEIKSGKSPDDGNVDSDYVDDLAYTRLVAGGAGLKIARLLLVLINRDYRLNGAAAMFALLDVTDAVNARAAEFAVLSEDVARNAGTDERPAPELIFACKDCAFFDTECVGRGIPDPLFMIPRISAKKFEALKVYERISRLPPDADLTHIQFGVVDVIRSGKPKVDHEGLCVLDELQWPVRYLDFEAVNPHLPWFEAAAPYETVPFQYSMHSIEESGAEVHHKEYLAPIDGDWRRELAESLLSNLGERGSIVVYSGYEKGRLKALGETFPDLAPQFTAAIARLFDLERVFKKGYQHPGFGGRTSIKKVLPVMVPELSYNRLAVNNGDDALGVFGLMRVRQIEEAFVPTQRERLLEYCKLDTYAMVCLHRATTLIRAEA